MQQSLCCKFLDEFNSEKIDNPSISAKIIGKSIEVPFLTHSVDTLV